MTFVFPILLGGLALTAVPILLHLIRREKPRTLRFPAFRFLLARHKTNLRKLRLRHLILLALRVLLLAGICLALARPKFFYAGLNWSTDRPVAAILLFDTSPSMEYKTSDGVTRLDDAKKRGLEMLDELPEGSRIAVYETGDSTLTGHGEWLVSRSAARERIASLKMQPVNGPVSRTLEQAFRLFAELANDKEENLRELPRFLCVFSDRTRSAWESSTSVVEAAQQVPALSAGLQRAREASGSLIELLSELRVMYPPPPGKDYPEGSVIDALKQLREKPVTPGETGAGIVNALRPRLSEISALLQERKDPPAEVKEYHSKLIAGLQSMLANLRGFHAVFMDVGAENPTDLAILDIELPRQAGGRSRQTFPAGEKIVLQVIVQATGKDFESALTGRIGKRTFKQAVSVPAGQRRSVPFEIDTQELGPGVHQLEIRLATADPLAINNTRFATFMVRRPEKILVLADDPERTEPFTKALRALSYLPEMKTPVEILGTADPRKLNEYKGVFMLGLANPPPALWEMLAGYVQRGGGLGIVAGAADMKPPAYNKGPAQKLMPGQWSQLVTHKQSEPGKDAGVVWDLERENIFQHPFMQPFRSWKGDNNYDFVRFPRRTASYWAVSPNNKGMVLVHYDDEQGRPAVLERLPESETDKPGHVLLFTTTLDRREPAWHNYMENSFYVGLVWLSTRYLIGEAEELDLNFIAGRGVPVARLPLSPRFPVYTLRGPDLVATLTVEEGQNLLRLAQAVNPGNYIVQGSAEEQTVTGFSVNLPSDESNLSRVPETEIESLFGQGAIVSVDRRLSLRESLRGHWSEPIDLFPLLMLLLLCFLAVENLLGNKFYKTEREAS